MNCKPGELAVFVSSYAGNEGKIINVLRVASSAELDEANFTKKYGTVWHTKEDVRYENGLYGRFALDFQLRPIRPDEGQDEILRIAGLPKKEREVV